MKKTSHLRLDGRIRHDGRSAERRHRAYAEGYRQMDAFTPFPVEGLAEAIGFHKTRLPVDLLIGGLMGASADSFSSGGRM